MHKQKIKVIFSLILILVFMLNVVSAQATLTVEDHWAKQQLNKWVQKGYIKGYGDNGLKPDAEITRVEFITLINRAFGLTEKTEVSFKDIKPNYWGYNEIAIAKKAGYIAGFADGTFRPNDKISKQEAAIIISRLMGLKTDINPELISSFKDSNNLKDWSIGSISAAVLAGYMSAEKDGSFLPNKKLTRAEAIVALDNCYPDYISIEYNKAGTYSAGNVDKSIEINVPDVVLENTTIEGNLIIGEGVGSGEVTLKNVTVKGETFVRGGGMNSILLQDSVITKIVIEKIDNKVRIYATGNTKVTNVDMLSGAKLEQENKDVVIFENIIISSDVDATVPIILSGNFPEVEVKASGIELTLDGKIDKLNVAETADNIDIEVLKQSTISNLVTEAAINVTGKGTVENADVKAAGTTIEANVGNITKPEGVEVTVVTPTTSTPSVPSESTNNQTPSEPSSGNTSTPSPTPERSAPILASDVVILNNGVGETDTITINNVNPGDVIKIYDYYMGSVLLATLTVANGQSSITTNDVNLGIYNGMLAITVTNPGKLESLQTRISYYSAAVITDLTIYSRDGIFVGGTLDGGYTIKTDNNPSSKHLIEWSHLGQTGDFRAGKYGLKLTQPNAALKAYYRAKGLSSSDTAELDSIADGNSPLIYFEIDSTTFLHIRDGFLMDTADTALKNISSPFVINGDFPEGTYTVTGKMTGIYDSITNVSITFTISRGTSTGSDATNLSNTKNAANNLAHNTTVGTAIGQTTQAARDEFITAIIAAQDIYNIRQAKTQAELDAATADLQAAIDIFKSKVNKDATALNNSIATANQLLTEHTEGTGVGQTTAEARTNLQNAINTAQAIYDTRATKLQPELDAATTNLNNAITTFNSSIVQAP